MMMTFGAEGGVTGHPDHSMAGIFATLAFHWAGRPNRYPDQLKNGSAAHITQKLYYQTAEAPLPNRSPITLPPATAVIEIGEHLKTKIAAFKAHKTQAPLWPIFEQNVSKRGSNEMFHLVAAVNRQKLLTESDLFAGIAEVATHPTKIA